MPVEEASITKMCSISVDRSCTHRASGKKGIEGVDSTVGTHDGMKRIGA
jgi:hypothetical protein